MISQKLGSTAIPTDFDDSYITPEFDEYSNDNDDGSPRMPEAPVIEIEPTSEVGDNSVVQAIEKVQGSHFL